MRKLVILLIFIPVIGLAQTPNSILSAELDTFIQNQMNLNNKSLK